MEKETNIGLTVKKSENSSEWYSQVLQKAELIDYTQVSGCYILRPASFAIWEKVQSFFDARIKEIGVKNAYFPIFIPESLFSKEAEHVEGFTPEVAWVTHGGSHKLSERLAIRPTSETTISDAYSRWVRSHRDLPIRLNQWCNIVRWEFKHPTPFLRGREFLWQEGHTIFATQEEAEKEVMDILLLYKRVYEELLALPVILGRKTESEKFAGAQYTLCVESFPLDRSVQSSTSHYLGQSFPKAYNIQFLDVDGKKKYCHQNSWGISTRSVGAMILAHGDDKGLVVPPMVADTHVMIVPILFDETKKKVLEYANKVRDSITQFHVGIDDRDCYKPGFKFNEWELKGIPLRIEVGPKDMEKDQAVLVRRDTGDKEVVKFKDIDKKVGELLRSVQKNLFNKAKEHLETSIVDCSDIDGMRKAIKEDKKIARIAWCESDKCEDKVINEIETARSMCMPLDQPKEVNENCAVCNKPAKVMLLFTRPV